jgi:predicted amidohydrolase YtcJ
MNYYYFNKLIKISLAILFTVILGACASSDGHSNKQREGRQDADRVLFDAKLFSAVEGSGVVEHQAVAIRGEQIIYVGSNTGADKFIGNNTLVQDVDGKLVMPGLIDGHTHPGLIALLANAMPIPEGLSHKELLVWLKDFAEDNPDLPYILGGSWAVNDYGIEGPNKHELDSVVSDRPIVLMDDSGHSAWVNTKTLELLTSTEDPAPGLSYFVRDAQGELTGWIKEMAMVSIIDQLHKPDDDMPEILEFFLSYLSSYGVTTLMDGGNMNSANVIYPQLKKMDEEKGLPLLYEGVHHIYVPQQIDTAVDDLLALRNKYQTKNLRFNTIKIHYDGVMEIRTAAMLEGFNDQPSNKGRTIVKSDRLLKLLKQANAEHIDLHIHTVGDAAIRSALDAYEQLQKEVGAQVYTRLTLAHLEYINPADIPRFKQLGVVANYTPHWHGGSYEGADEALGKRQQQRMVVQPLLDSGAIVSFSSDVVTPDEFERANPFLGMQVAHNRQDIEGGEEAIIMQPLSDRLSLTDLLVGYSRNAAYQLRLEDKQGTLEVGKDANIVIMRDDLFDMDRYDIHTAKVDMTLRQGKVVYERDFSAIFQEWMFELFY